MAARLHQFFDPNSRLANLIESKYLRIIMLLVVLSNTCVMIFETYDYYYQTYNSFFLLIEKIYICIYILECCLKLWVYSWKYFRNLWNCFDLFIICVSIVDLIAQEITYDTTQSSLQIDYTQQTRINHLLKFLRVLRVLRSFRALRVLRTIRFIQPIHTIVKTCFKALPAMASIAFIMIIITCISAIMARSLFEEICPKNFDNLAKTFFSLFTLLTLDDWYSIYQDCAEHDYASFLLIFCLIYIFIINFILLNLLMAVLVDSFQYTLETDKNKHESTKKDFNINQRIEKNFNSLLEDYCDKQRDDEITGENSIKIDKLMKDYYILLENLEFRMERHEQLTRLAQKAMKFTVIDQDNRKTTAKK